MFHKEFGSSFRQSDVLIVTDVYAAREDPIEGVTGELVVRAARECGHKDARYIRDKENAVEELMGIVRQGDIVITVGAGDIWKVANRLLEVLS
jgi:UDP-N-acetylmuramate--alanine ligase